MGDELMLEELSRSTGEPVERLSQWRSLGLIGAEGGEGFRPEDVEKVRLVQLFLRRGISLEAIADAFKGGLVEGARDVLMPAGAGPRFSLEEAAEMVGMDVGVLRRLWDAAGLGNPDELVDENDIEMMKGLKVSMDTGLPEEALAQMARVYSDALNRVTEAEQRIFHFYVLDRLDATGVSRAERAKANEAAAARLNPLVEPVLLYFHRKGLAKALREDLVMHLAEEAGLLEKSEVPGQLQTAIAFVDLSSFTPLAEAMGDVKAAEVLER
ncbi:MAG: adenylate cyclase regulatory domain-containing protein, partial [Dehalococcoidia bacterium]